MNEILTSKNIILIILISFRADLDETVQSVIVNELMDQIFVILEKTNVTILNL